MNRVQEQKHHLALANRQIAELAVQIVRQRVIVKHALDTGQRSEMAEFAAPTLRVKGIPTKTSQLHKSDSEQRVRMGCPPLITKEGLAGKGGGYRRRVSANSIDGS